MSLKWDGKRPVVDCSKDKGFTVQADRDDADINKIISRFEKTGTVMRMNRREPFYGDVSEFGGLAEAIMMVNEADELFMQMDANVRERFDNDPVRFVEFLADEKNYDEALKLGIVQKRPDVSAEGGNSEPPAPPPGGAQ